MVQTLTNLTSEEKGLLQNEDEKSDIPAMLSERDEVIKLINRNRTLGKEVESHLLDISEEERKVEKLKDDLQQMNDTFREVLTIPMNGRQVQTHIDFDKETVLAEKIKEFDGKYPRCSHELHELLKVQSVVVKQTQESTWSLYINVMVTEYEALYRQLHGDFYELYLQCDTDPDYWSNDHLPSEPSTPGQSMASCVSGQDAVLRELSMGLNDEQRAAFRGSIALSEEEENVLKKSPQEFLGLIIGKEPLLEGKDLKQYLIEKLEAGGSSDVEHVNHCFDATASTTHEENVDHHDLDHPTAMSTPKAGTAMLRRSASDIFPKPFRGPYTVDDLYMRLMAFRDVIPVLLNQLPATDRLKHKTLRMQSTPEVLLHRNVSMFQ
ncbi:hypothetical protein KP79_PYT02924 [Mizuhopecten yessoensis]|uniref:Uncharacterized protein n=2 Tax=Mizuhopecten yessoensis TaxID=6573 RepID=A0A210PJS8_MIZYE|nr:hypothetical protein KP79_PYT02924 [Mizuhopecten yessoensis]